MDEEKRNTSEEEHPSDEEILAAEEESFEEDEEDAEEEEAEAGQAAQDLVSPPPAGQAPEPESAPSGAASATPAAGKEEETPRGGCGFVHLHNHSDYSLLDGEASIPRYVAKAKSVGMNALALTDHGNMYGAIQFYNACTKAGIKPILGTEFYCNPEDHTWKPEGGQRDTSHRYHLILLAMDEEGYHNLMELNSAAWTEGFYYKPRIDDKLLEKHNKGLICLSACLAGEIIQNLLADRYDEAKRRAAWFKSVFGDRYYIELQDHGLPEQKKSNPLLVKIAKELGIPVVCTNDIHYIEKEDAEAQEVMLCIGTGGKLDDKDHMKFPCDEFYFKTPDEMREIFSWCPEAIANTQKIADRCHLELHLPGPMLPIFQPPKGFRDSDKRFREFMERTWNAPEFTKYVSPEIVEKMSPTSRDQAEYLILLANQGLIRRYGEEKADGYLSRLVYELGVIIKMDFQGYFLIVRDYIYWAKTHGIPVGPGRGSGAGSLVAYSIDITNVDPMEYNLLFERFLNPERVSMPDFDVDFDFEYRQQVINYVMQHYGKDHVAKIATFSTLKPKQAVKDVARVLGFSFQESADICKLIPDDPKLKTIEQAFAINPELQQWEDKGDKYARLFQIARKLQGLTRGIGTHACGIVIGQTRIADYVPCCIDTKVSDPNELSLTTQYDKHYIEDCGLVKMDFLGLQTLTLIRHCTDLIHKKNPDFDIEKIDLADRKTFDMLDRGDSMMVFQFESGGMQDILRQAHPNCIEDLVALNALYRPGPMQFIPRYVQSKADPAKIKYDDPDFKDILKGTYGVIVYQEEVMQVAQVFAGYTLGEADNLRRIMGKKQMDKLPKEEEKFIKKSLAKGRDEKHAHEIFEMLKPFAGYGFNKSHAVAYSIVAYQTAWLKANYPVEFIAANLTNEMGNPAKFNEYLDVCKTMHIEVVPPDINTSEASFTVSGGNIVYGLAGIKNVGEGVVNAFIAEREKNGPFKDFMDFLSRMDCSVNSKMLESLIKAGAFDSLGTNRATLLFNMEGAQEFIAKQKEATAFGQMSLFGGTSEIAAPSFQMVPQQDWTLQEKLESEKELLGFYISGHPLDSYRDLIRKIAPTDTSDHEKLPFGKTVNVIAQVTGIRQYISPKNKHAMAFIELADLWSGYSATLFSDGWAMYKDMLVEDGIYGFVGKFDNSRGTDKLSFIIDQVMKPEELPEAPPDPFDAWKDVIKRCVTADITVPDHIPLGRQTNLVARLDGVRPHTSQKSGKEMGFLDLCTPQGKVSATLYPRGWAEFKGSLLEGTIYGFVGKFDKWNGRISFLVDDVRKPDQLESRKLSRCHVALDRSRCDGETMQKLRDLCLEHPGTLALRLIVADSAGKPTEIECGRDYTVRGDDDFSALLENLGPVESVWYD